MSIKWRKNNLGRRGTIKKGVMYVFSDMTVKSFDGNTLVVPPYVIPVSEIVFDDRLSTDPDELTYYLNWHRDGSYSVSRLTPLSQVFALLPLHPLEQLHRDNRL